MSFSSMKPMPHLLYKGTIPLKDVQYSPLFFISILLALCAPQLAPDTARILVANTFVWVCLLHLIESYVASRQPENPLAPRCDTLRWLISLTV